MPMNSFYMNYTNFGGWWWQWCLLLLYVKYLNILINIAIICLILPVGNSLGVQWLGLSASLLGPGFNPGRGTEILQVTWPKKQTNNKISQYIFSKSIYLKLYGMM